MEDESSVKPQQHLQPPKLVVLADLNVDPPEIDDEEDPTNVVSLPLPDAPRVTNGEGAHDKGASICKENNDTAEVEGKRSNKSGKCRYRSGKLEDLEYGADADGDPYSPSVSSSRDEKFSSLKTGLIHVVRKIPKNAHAHFLLGLMYQRLGQPQKAVMAYEKAEEILLRSGEEIDRPELLSLVQIHHAQCILLESLGDSATDKELEPEELEEVITKLKESMQLDIRHAAVWNTLGVTLLKTGRLQSAISIFASLFEVAPDNLDCLGNLGLAHLQSGNLEAGLNSFRDLVLKDQGHPSALINYAAVILCKCGSVVSGGGANCAEAAASVPGQAANVATECLLAAVKVDPRSSHAWANLGNAFYIMGDHRSCDKCLEKAAELEPSCMSTRYAAAVHRIKDSERSQNPTEQLPWAGNEMASVLRDGDPLLIDLPMAWAGLAMVHKSQHEITAAFDTEQNKLMEIEEGAMYSLKQAVGQDPDDAINWHQLGLHCLHTQQFTTSQRYLKAAVARLRECSYIWSNLGISLQLGEDATQAEEVFSRALSLATSRNAHAMFSNLGNLYRQQRKYDCAKAMYTKSLKIQPGYAPAYNNLGLVFVAEGQLEEAKFCFEKASKADPLLDAAKSNWVKVMSLMRTCSSFPSSMNHD